jgi:flagellar motor switch protein FliN/FliY
MPAKPEIITKYNNAQNSLWQSVTTVVSDSVGLPTTFSDPVSAMVPVSDLYGEMASPKLVIQFAFAHEPDNAQVLLLSDEIVGELYQSLTGQKPGIIDDSKVTELRTVWESIIQGICLAAGQIRGEAVVATNLSIRYQIFSFPNSMQKTDEVFRTVVTFSTEAVRGTALWIVEPSSAMSLIRVAEDDDTPTKPARSSGPELTGENPLDMLGDIPLDITVELGRLRMVVRDVVELGSGSIIEIDKAAGEPVDVLVNGRLVARGEVVVIEDNFGVRITEILTPQERLASLREAA